MGCKYCGWAECTCDYKVFKHLQAKLGTDDPAKMIEWIDTQAARSEALDEAMVQFVKAAHLEFKGLKPGFNQWFRENVMNKFIQRPKRPALNKMATIVLVTGIVNQTGIKHPEMVGQPNHGEGIVVDWEIVKATPPATNLLYKCNKCGSVFKEVKEHECTASKKDG